MSNGPTSENITRADGRVSGAARAAVAGHGALTVWFTGLSGSGKSTLAFAVEHRLVQLRRMAYVLDGDNIRFGLNRDLGFSPDDRTENIRRIGEVCRLFHDAGLISLTAFISPYVADRGAVRAMHPNGRFMEVFVDTPIEICEERDVKGLYAKARAGEIPDFSGVSAPYEPPMDPEVRIDTTKPVAECVDRVVAEIESRT